MKNKHVFFMKFSYVIMKQSLTLYKVDFLYKFLINHMNRFILYFLHIYIGFHIQTSNIILCVY